MLKSKENDQVLQPLAVEGRPFSAVNGDALKCWIKAQSTSVTFHCVKVTGYGVGKCLSTVKLSMSVSFTVWLRKDVQYVTRKGVPRRKFLLGNKTLIMRGHLAHCLCASYWYNSPNRPLSADSPLFYPWQYLTSIHLKVIIESTSAIFSGSEHISCTKNKTVLLLLP